MYVGEGIDNPQEIIDGLKKGKSLFGIYLICIETNSPFLMEIFNSAEIFKNFYKNKQYKVIGICKGKQDAFLTVVKIIKNYLETSNDFKEFKDHFYLKN